MPVKITRTKVVVVGASAVGKTAMIQVYTSDGREFPKNYNMTLGIDLSAKRVQIPNADHVVEMLLYDSTGFDLYTDTLSLFWDRPDMLMVVCDVTSPQSFDTVTDWHKIALSAEWAPVAKCPIASVLFANKKDCTMRRVVAEKSGRELAEKLDMQYFEGSAKENQGVDDAFCWLAEEFYKNTTKSMIKPTYDSFHKSVLRSNAVNA